MDRVLDPSRTQQRNAVTDVRADVQDVQLRVLRPQVRRDPQKVAGVERELRHVLLE
jgi:hypothetical protein